MDGCTLVIFFFFFFFLIHCIYTLELNNVPLVFKRESEEGKWAGMLLNTELDCELARQWDLTEKWPN